VVAEATRRLPERLVAAYLEMLVGKGYVRKDSAGRYKVSDKKFLDLLLEAADDINKKVAPIKNWKDPRPVLAGTWLESCSATTWTSLTTE
jgi:hypothetical protein